MAQTRAAGRLRPAMPGKRQRQLDECKGLSTKAYRTQRNETREFSSKHIGADSVENAANVHCRFASNGPVSSVSAANAHPGRVLCREHESMKLTELIITALDTGQGLPIYVPGQPGSGKTLTVNSVLREINQASPSPPAIVNVNCMERSATELGYHVYTSLSQAKATSGQRPRSGTSKQIMDRNGEGLRLLKNLVVKPFPSKDMHIIVLDEMDHACKHAATFVADLFTLCSLKHSSLIVIGIANQLDLAEKMLCIFGSRGTSKLRMVPFHSYSAKQLCQAQYVNKFADNAIELIAKRVSKSSGDMRVAQAVCAAAIFAHTSTHDRLLGAGGPVRHDSDGSSSLRPLVPVSVAAASLAASAAGGSTQAHVSEIQRLPAQQQLLLCTLALARAPASVAAVSAHMPCLSPFPSKKMFAPRSPVTPLENVPRSKYFQHQLQTPERAPFSDVSNSKTLCLGALSRRPSPSISFPIADAPLATPSSAASPGMLSSGKHSLPANKSNVQEPAKSGMQIEELYAKYKAACDTTGLPATTLQQVQTCVAALHSLGLVQMAAKGSGTMSGSGVGLAVSTQDVKYALRNSHMLQPLLNQVS